QPGEGPFVTLSSQVQCGTVRRFQPADGGHAAAPGVDPQDNLLRVTADDLLEPAGVFHGAGANDHALDAPAQHFLDVFLGADAPAELAGHARGVNNRPDGRDVYRATFLGTVQVNNVQKPGALVHPAL